MNTKVIKSIILLCIPLVIFSVGIRTILMFDTDENRFYTLFASVIILGGATILMFIPLLNQIEILFDAIGITDLKDGTIIKNRT